MTNNIAANYTMPSILDTLKPAANGVTAKAAGASDGSGSGAGTSGVTGLGSTFLSLLVKELQNQDPTAPMDSTAMVGQMISLNQLDQLISINQIIGGSPGGLTGSKSEGASAAATMPTANPLASAVAKSQLPFDPNTMMPVGTGATNATNLNSPLNIASMGFPGYSNTILGGK